MTDYPIVLGVYSRITERTVGTGTTKALTRQVTYWFARQPGEDVFEIQPLNVFHVPAGVRTLLARAEFLEHYTPEPTYYADNPVHALRSLHAKLRSGIACLSDGGFSKEEWGFVGAFLADHPGEPGECGPDDPEGREARYRYLLATVDLLIGDGETSVAFCCRKLNAFGVSLRKNRQLDRSISFLSRAIAMNPRDDHAHFNIARSYFDKNDLHNCQEHLSKALAINPAFREARLFSAFCDRYEAETAGRQTA